MTGTDEEVEALRRRIAALEARLARLGQDDDDVYPCVRTREVQLHGPGSDGKTVVRGRLHTYQVDGEAFAELQLLDGHERVRVGVSVGGSLPTVVLFDEEEQPEAYLIGGLAPTNEAALGLGRGGGGTTVHSGADGSGVKICDSQGRERAMFGVTGDLEDRAVLRLDDADGDPGVVFSTGTVDQATALAGWPGWVHDVLTGAESHDDADDPR